MIASVPTLEFLKGQYKLREDPAYRIRRLTREEYHRAAEAGLFGSDERLELLHGEVFIKMSPQLRPHASAILACGQALTDAFGEGFHVQQQLPIRIQNESEPEPDIAVVTGSWRDYADHPTPVDIRLIVEVSDSTLNADRGRKAALYAEAGIADYWVLNLISRRVESHREPAAFSDSPFGFAYKSITIYTEEEDIRPLAAPNSMVSVASLLPPQHANRSSCSASTGSTPIGGSEGVQG